MKILKYAIVLFISFVLFCLTSIVVSCAQQPQRSMPTETETGIESFTQPQTEAETEPETTVAPTTITPTEPTKPIEPLTEAPTTIAEIQTVTYYAAARVNVRTLPNLTGEVLATLNLNEPVLIVEYVEDGWSTIIFNNKECFIYSKYLSANPVIAPAEHGVVADSGEFHYYGIWSGEWWHFTPEQIDTQWRGLKPSKPALELGTTRAWQKYLYESLCAKGLGWWYKYACAQAMQESGFNPLNNSSTDHGLFSFRERYWNYAYGDIYDYHANINAYIDRIYPYLANVSSDDAAGIDLALSQHYNPGYGIIMEYVNAVRGRLNELWICD